MKNKAFIILSFVLFPLIVGLACTCGLLPIGGDKVEETEEQVLVVPSVSGGEELPTEIPSTVELPTEEEIVTEEKTQPVETEGDMISTSENLVLQKENWGGNDEYTFVGFILYNQSKDLSLTDVDYTITLRDSADQEIINDSGIYPYLLPGEKIAVFYQNPIDENNPPVHSVDVTYGYEDTEVSDHVTSPFSTEKLNIGREICGLL